MSSKSVADRNDLTQGPILKKLITFAIPVILGNLCMQLYNVVDSVIVGNYVGTDALAAVGASFSIMMLFNALFLGVSMGAQIVISQTYGGKDFDGLRIVTNTGIALAIIIGTIITILGVPLSGALLELINTPANIRADATSYLMIIFAGTLGNVFYNLGAGILRGMGDSRWPLIAMLASSLVNIVLDLVFVIYFDMGVAGVAWATSIAHFVSGLIPLFRLQSGKYPVRLHIKDLLHPNGFATKRIISLGLPSAVQNMAMSLGGIVIQSFANTFGSNYIAANTIIMKADGFAIMPMMGLGMAATTFVGQNIGAGNQERAKRGVHAGQISAVIVAAAVGILLFFTGRYIMLAFGAGGEVLNMGVSGIRFLAFCYWTLGIDNVTGGSMRGAGAAVAPSVTAVMSTVCRIPLTYFLAALPQKNHINDLLAEMPQNLVDLSTQYFDTGVYKTLEEAQRAAAAVIAAPDHYMGMFYAMGASMLLGMVFIFTYFKSGRWRKHAEKTVGVSFTANKDTDGDK